MIEIKDLSFKYSKNEIFKNISLSFTEGQIYGLLGENGVGKTTLLKILTGLQKVNKTECVIDGQFPYDRTPSLLGEIYFLPEETSIHSGTMDEYAKSMGPFYPNFSIEKFYNIMREMDVNPKAKFEKLSLGQKKKSMIAYALSLNTKYLFMDEPSNGLDIPSKQMLRMLIARQCTEESVIIISTHQVKDMENLINPIVILDKDSVLLEASLEEVSSKLYFDYSKEQDPNAIYSERTPGGYINVTHNTCGVESKVNIETLFNATIANRDLFKTIINNK